MSKIETMSGLNASLHQLEIVKAAGEMQQTMQALEMTLSEERLRQVLAIVARESAKLFSMEIRQTLTDVIATQEKLIEAIGEARALIEAIPKPPAVQKRKGTPFNLPKRVVALEGKIRALETLVIISICIAVVSVPAPLILLWRLL
ncbi:hypothetical protein [Pseudomonas aeruginosa]|uniref:hypothetical protein n=1 Tax=Pseudomonas aeruginosa TaxID=287 RepID=UPI0029C054D1|nr:hypothetical protein [Pseudomonas aeruginosa]